MKLTREQRHQLKQRYLTEAHRVESYESWLEEQVIKCEMAVVQFKTEALAVSLESDESFLSPGYNWLTGDDSGY